MKRFIIISIAMIMAIAILTVTADAGDKLLDTTIDSVTVALDKNTNEYVRFIITEDRKIGGVAYKRSLPVMAFGNHVDSAKAYQAGDQLKAIVNHRKLADGRESYTILGYTE